MAKKTLEDRFNEQFDEIESIVKLALYPILALFGATLLIYFTYRSINYIFSDNALIFGALLIFIIQQLLQKHIFDPIYLLKRTIAQISSDLKFYANIYTNSGLKNDLYIDTSKTLRRLSCDLEANYMVIPFKKYLTQIKFIPDQKNIDYATKGLIRLSNSCGFIDVLNGVGKNESIANDVRKNLGINIQEK